MKNKWSLLIFSIGISLLAGAIGSIFSIKSIPTWYATLNKPSFNPPNWLFGPVWTILYILMGISLYLILTSKHKKKNEAVKYFFVQLALNAIWSILFFGFRSPAIALIEIIIFWACILMTIVKSYKVNKAAAGLLIPYICWVSFASILNLYIVILN